MTLIHPRIPPITIAGSNGTPTTSRHLFLVTLVTLLSLLAFSPQTIILSANAEDTAITIQQSITPKQILKYHNKPSKSQSSIKNFPNLSLGYVTPWNNHGYDIAKQFGRKFDFISPVWYQIHRIATNKYVLKGGHDVDQNWITDVRTNSLNHTKIVPRMMLEFSTEDDFQALIQHETEMRAFVSAIILEIRQQNFAGMVFECPAMLIPHIVRLFDMLHTEFKSPPKGYESLSFILVLPPLVKLEPQFVNMIAQLEPLVDAWSVMTYDYSNLNTPGPNSPLHWLKPNIEKLCGDSKPCRAKFLLGMNFYGNDFYASPLYLQKHASQLKDKGGPIVGSRYLELLGKIDKNEELEWDKESGEHYFHYHTKDGGSASTDNEDDDDDENDSGYEEEDENDSRRVVWYPTLYSIKLRLDLAKEMGCGVAVWEIGQGLDYFVSFFAFIFFFGRVCY